MRLLQLDPGSGAIVSDQALPGLTDPPWLLRPIPGGWLMDDHHGDVVAYLTAGAARPASAR